MTEAIAAGAGRTSRRIFVYRHPLVIRITHWVNVLCLTILLMSGLQIFNAHPALYWGAYSDFDNPVLSMRPEREGDGYVGVTRIFDARFDTTGLFGLSAVNGRIAGRGFPSWLTIPSYQDLATGRVWHFFFAWLFVANALLYLGFSLLSRHLWRDLLPSAADLRAVPRTILDHLRFRFVHHGEAARHYNVLQKLAYLGIILVVLPLVVLAGLAMSPGIDAAFPWLVDLFGGRQSARTIHFICAFLLVLFVVVHVLMVIVSGVLNNLRSMVTGWYALPAPEKPHE